MGVPVVCSQAAAGGVDATPEAHLLAATTPDETTTAILRILDQRSERERLAAAGRARVVSHHAWPNSMKRLDSIIDRSLSAFPPHPKLHPQTL
jgi:glycosyltransferase involved in cell wall biosynthesis